MMTWNIRYKVIIAFLKSRLIVLNWLLKAVRLYFAGILTVMTAYYVFIRLTPGQDVIMQVGESSGPFWWTLICVFLWSVYVWYSSRLIGYSKVLQTDAYIPQSFHEHIPRLLAYNALISIQAAIVALPSLGKFSQPELWLFVGAQNVLYFLWSSIFQKSGKKRRVYFIIMISATAAYILLLLNLRQHGPRASHQQWLPPIAFLLFCTQLTLVYFFIHRRNIIGKEHTARLREKKSPEGRLKFLDKETISIPRQFQDKEQPFYVAFNILAACGVILYCAGFFIPELSEGMGPLAFTLLAFGVLVGLSNIVTTISISRKTNFFFFLLLWAMMIGNIYDPYAVRLTSPIRQGIYGARPDPNEYFKRWITHREKYIEKADTFDVYLVIADGGASRSGYWVASVLSSLQDDNTKRDSIGKFSDHLFCLAGASGGSLGTATFYGLLKNKKPGEGNYLKNAQAFLKKDFLTPVITHWLGSDFLQHLIPLPLSDRSAALELALEHFAKDSLYDEFAKPMSDVIDLSGRLPVLFINTTHVQQGAPAVISTVHLKPFSQRMDVLDSVEKTSQKKGHGDIRLSTAVVLGARFPYVSPAGSIGKEDFVDGGYFDNTGAGIVHELMQYLDSVVSTEKDPIWRRTFSKLRFKLIHISNSSLKAATDAKLNPLENDLASPLLTVFSTYSSQTSVNDQRLITFLRRRGIKRPYLKINLYSHEDTVDYPMNWVISRYNLNRMNGRLPHAIKDFNEW